MSSREGLRSTKSKSTDSNLEIIMSDALKGTEGALDTMVDNIIPKIRDTIIQTVKSYLKESLELAVKPLVELQCKPLYERIQRLEEQNYQLNTLINEHQSYSRLDNLIFCGLECQSYADAATGRGEGGSQGETDGPSGDSNLTAEEAIIKLCRDKLDVSVAPSDISIAHRLGGRKTKKISNNTQNKPVAVGGSTDPEKVTPSPQSIIARFTNRKIRDAIFRSKRKLHKTGIYINEHLSQSTNQLYAEARKKVKAKQIHATWTFQGKIYIKDSENGPPRLYAQAAPPFRRPV